MKIILTLIFMQNLSFATSCPEHLKNFYENLQTKASKLAGQNEDISQRVEVYKEIYQDPAHHGQFHFPLIAAHGAKWLESMIPEYNQQISDVLASSWTIFNREKQTRKKARASGVFIGSLLSTNKNVFIDTYTLYYFIKKYHKYKNIKYCLERIWPKDVNGVLAYFEALKDILTNNSLSKEKLREHYYTTLTFEQESMVSEQVNKAFDEYRKKWRLGAIIAQSPTVQFSYFPQEVVFYFSDFSQTKERVKYALRSYDIAVNYTSHMQKVFDALSYYP